MSYRIDRSYDFEIFTAGCYAERGYEIVCRLYVTILLSICNV